MQIRKKNELEWLSPKPTDTRRVHALAAALSTQSRWVELLWARVSITLAKGSAITGWRARDASLVLAARKHPCTYISRRNGMHIHRHRAALARTSICHFLGALRHMLNLGRNCRFLHASTDLEMYSSTCARARAREVLRVRAKVRCGKKNGEAHAHFGKKPREG